MIDVPFFKFPTTPHIIFTPSNMTRADKRLDAKEKDILDFVNRFLILPRIFQHSGKSKDQTDETPFGLSIYMLDKSSDMPARGRPRAGICRYSFVLLFRCQTYPAAAAARTTSIAIKRTVPPLVCTWDSGWNTLAFSFSSLFPASSGVSPFSHTPPVLGFGLLGSTTSPVFGLVRMTSAYSSASRESG